MIDWPKLLIRAMNKYDEYLINTHIFTWDRHLYREKMLQLRELAGVAQQAEDNYKEAR